jgi:hypothetical protein
MAISHDVHGEMHLVVDVADVADVADVPDLQYEHRI